MEPGGSSSLRSRLDGYFDRSPYIVAAIFFAAMAILFDSSRGLYHAHGRRTWTDWVVLGFVVYACGALFLLPRLALRGPKPPSDASLARLRIVVAAAPFLVGFGAWSIGGDEWSAAVAFSASAVLLLVGARITASRTRG